MYKDILRSKGVSVTQNRIALLETLDALNKPVTIEYLQSHLDISMNVTTVYRSLRAMVDAGIVYQTHFHDGVAYFEFQQGHHHHHFVCTVCKNISPVNFCVAEKFASFEKDTGHKIHNHMFELFGQCYDCRDDNTTKTP